MARLEDLGYVRQPHTSAGRMPTDQGYRFYVDNLRGIEALSAEGFDVITPDTFGETTVYAFDAVFA